ncbi:MAG: homoserine dehydrogenase [Candidatus Omnitrophota bacterium]|jgi:homoserine dehydrogenase
MKKIYIGLLGFGNVGADVIKILRTRKALLRNKLGCDLVLKKVCDKNLTAKRDISLPREILTTDAKQIFDDPSIDIVIELIGGIHPAKEFITQALNKGKYVVTANKALLAEQGNQIFNLAKERGKSIYFEAAVGAGIPIIKSLKEGFSADRFRRIFGILNGTSNFILSAMSQQNLDFAQALLQAKKSGFAERDARLDIQGIDSLHKLVILVYLCFGKLVNLGDVFVDGIQHISLLDIGYAKELGYQIKLLAIAERQDSELELRVHPTLIPQEHLLAKVKGINNAIYVSTDLAGDLLFFGPGAGRTAAASAVVSDLQEAVKDLEAGLFRRKFLYHEDRTIKKLRRIEQTQSRYYIRFMVVDQPGVLAAISSILAKYDISIASVTQKERKRAKVVPIVMIFHEAKEKNLRLALKKIEGLKVVRESPVPIRIEQI